MKSNYDILVSKIKEFTQKFYLNKLLRGSIYTLALLLGLYLALFLLVYFTNPPVALKTVLFFLYIGAAIVSISGWMLRPALSYVNLNKHLSIEQSAELIGLHFFNVRDKLLNTLQLKELADQSPDDNALILAGIDQKILELKPIPFTSAVRLADNRRHLKYFLVPLAVILLIAFIAPAILKEGTYSFVQYNKEITRPAPFQFTLENTSLLASQGDDLTLQLKMSGEKIPQDIYLNDGANSYKLEKESNSRFKFTLKNLQTDKLIHFTASEVRSPSYRIRVRPRPSVLTMTASLIFPPYLKKPPASIQDAGDLTIPDGTRVTWIFQTENSSSAVFLLGDKSYLLNSRDNHYRFRSLIRKNSKYQLFARSRFVSSKDSISHEVTIIKDEFPSIHLTATADSTNKQAFYFSGKIADDHGFTNLKFCYEVKVGGRTSRKVTKTLAIHKDQVENSFFLFWNIAEAALSAGQTLEYYFEVSDNDGVNGPKTTKSEVRIFEIPSPQQVSEDLEKGSSALKQHMEKAIRLAGQVEKESKKLAENLLDKKQLSFDDKKQVEQLLNKQKELEEVVKEVKELNQKNNQEKEDHKLLEAEMLEKQRQIDHLFDNVLNEKTKELLEKLQNLMEQQNKDQTQNELSKMQIDHKSLKNELDRILELYKQLEFEQTLKNNINRLNDLAKKQEEQAEKSKAGTVSPKIAKETQQKLSSEFNDLKKELEKMQQKNQELERPAPYTSPEKESREVQQQQKDSENKLDQGKNKEAAENQQQAAEQIKRIAAQLEKMQTESAEMESKVNAEELRQLLENLLNTSFEQEKVMLNLRTMTSSDPQYTVNVQKQRNIKDNMKTIADSLFSLSKRVPQIETAVNEEMQKINFNIDKSLESLAERNTGTANRNQQYTMTSINNLALMLNEALSQLQKNMKNAKTGGKGSSGKQSMSELQRMQQQLNNNMQKAKEQMERSDNQGKAGKGQMSQEFARMAQQQQLIREALQKLNREENKDGKGKLGNLNQLIQDMKSTENDLVNKRLEQETLKRQKNLVIKMLEAEHTEREQEQDAKREAKAAKDFPPAYRQMLENFRREQQSQTEWLQKLPPSLNEYYKNKIAEYFKLLNSAPLK